MKLRLVDGSANVPLAETVGATLGVEPCKRTIERFADGELHVAILDSVRGGDVYVIQPTSPPVDEHVMELIFLADACRRAGAARITAVVPYFGYARQDRRASGREAIGAAVVARLLEGAGVARVVAVDLHAPEIEGFFRIPLEHLSAAPLLAAAVRADASSVLVAPDLGAVRLAQRYHKLLHLPIAIVHKTRVSGADVVLRSLMGEVRGRRPIIVDDMISTAATVEAAAAGLVEAGCTPELSVLATHALFVGPAVRRLHALPIVQLVGTDSVQQAGELPAHFQAVSLAPMLADAIARLHRDESLDPLLVHA